MEWVLAAVVLWLLRARRRDRREHDRRDAERHVGEVMLPDGRAVLRVEGDLFAPSGPGEPGWRWIAVEGTADAQEQHGTTIAEVLSGSVNAGGGAAGSAPGVEVEAVPVLLVPVGTRRRVAAVDVFATGGRLGHLPADATARHGEELRAVSRVGGRPAGVEARVVRRPDGLLGTEVLLPDRFEVTPR